MMDYWGLGIGIRTWNRNRNKRYSLDEQGWGKAKGTGDERDLCFRSS